MPHNVAPPLANVTQNPLLVSPGGEELFQSCIQHVISNADWPKMSDATVNMSDDDDDFWPTTDNDWRAHYRPYNVKDGTLQIPVMGVLLNRFPFQLGRWATGYKYIEMALKRGLADDNVKRIAFVIDSGGGEVAGCFELGDKIFEARGQKPIRAFAADHAYSAAFVIFSSCDDGIVTRSGGTGSVGVVTAHVDYSDALQQMGLKITFIFAGKHKVDGNHYEKLPDAVKTRIQKRINKIYGVFTSTVARNRDMDEEAVKATEALTYDAQEALDIGFADKVGSLEDEMAIFATEASTEDSDMAEKETVETVAKATHEAAVASATAAGRTEGATAEKARVKAILASDEGKKRPKAALSCALNSDMSLEAATSFLADLAEETAPQAAAPAATTPAAGTSAFEKHMNADDHPKVGADADAGGGTGDKDADLSASILADYAGATGSKPAAKEKAA